MGAGQESSGGARPTHAPATHAPPKESSCDECDRIELTKRLDAAEAIAAHQRELDKLALTNDRELDKLRLAHERELEKLRSQHLHALQASAESADIASQKLFHETIAEIAKGSIERSRDSAKYVQTAATAISALYTGVLALVFSVTDHPLPARGVVAPVFLGLSIALATGYLAYAKKAGVTSVVPAGASAPQLAMHRTRTLTEHVNKTIFNKKWAIRASVLGLGVGVAFIAAPFVGAQRAAGIPAAPDVPSIPSQIAPEIAQQASELFAQQAQSYVEAVNARNGAIEAAAQRATEHAGRIATADWITLGLALVGLLLVLAGPKLFSDD